jgi:hypothetical protein
VAIFTKRLSHSTHVDVRLVMGTAIEPLTFLSAKFVSQVSASLSVVFQYRPQLSGVVVSVLSRMILHQYEGKNKHFMVWA